MKEEIDLSLLGTILATIGLSLGTFMFVLDYTIANVAIPYIAGDLAAGVEEGTYVLTFFAVGNAVFLPMTGWLSRRFGMPFIFLASVIGFTLFSLFCALAPSLLSLVIFRFFQGATAGPLIPLSQGILALLYPPKRLNFIMAILSLIVLVAPVFGPIVGGYFCVYQDWRWIFYINVPIGIISIIIVGVYLLKFNEKESHVKTDFLGFILLFISMTCLQIFLDKGQDWDWFNSIRIRICFVTFLIAFIYLILWSLMAKDPLLNLKVLLIKNFTIATICIFFSYSLYLGTVVVIPLWLQSYMYYDALWAGIAVCPIGIGALPMALLSPKLIEKMGRIPIMSIGLFIIALSCFYTKYFSFQIDLYHIMISRFFLGIGIGLWVVALLSMPAEALPKKEISSGLSLFHFVRGISGAIGISIYTTLFNRRTIHQHNNLISTFNEYRFECTEYFKQIRELGYGYEAAFAFLNRFIDRQASVIALDEVFLLMGIVAIILALFVLFGLLSRTSRSPSRYPQDI